MQIFINKTTTVFFLLMILVFSCSEKTGKVKTVDKEWLASVIKESDSSYSKPYYRSDFVTASYYINKKDSTICQVMKDSAGTIRQIIIVKNEVRQFFAQYYSNAQLQTELKTDLFGQYHGAALSYYEDGNIQTSGTYSHGLKTGEWKNFDKTGKLISTDEYDKKGQLIKTTKP